MTHSLSTFAKRYGRSTALAAILVLFSLTLPVPMLAATAKAATITVNTLKDETTSGDGLCSLREAINNANAKADTTGGTCAAGTGTDTIKFGVSGTITLVGSGLPPIQNTLTIDGTGQAITVDGANSFQVAVVNAGATLNVSDLTIAHGSARFGRLGGGIANSGTLTVTNSTFSGNRTLGGGGGGIGNGGTLTVTNSTFSGNIGMQNLDNGDGNGGGIANGGTLTVTNSTFSGNRAFGGGGIRNYGNGTLTVTNSSFSGNGADYVGGGIWNDGKLTIANSTFAGNGAGGEHECGTRAGVDFCDGGGILNDGTLSVTNSTFSGNGAERDGGGIWNGGTLTIADSTFSGNGAFSDGGGIFLWGSAAFRNSILAGNTGGNCSGPTTNGGDNISDDASCGFGTSKGANGKPIGDNVNPLLDPNGLQFNGGPTQTIGLQSTSPVIDAIPIAKCPATDERGLPRPDLGSPTETACDIGAFESSTMVWPMFHHDRRHSGLSPFSTAADKGIEKWKFPTDSYVYSSPAIGADGTVYVGSLDNNLYAIRPSGTMKWKFAAGDEVWSSPAVGTDGTIYVGSNDNNLYAVRPNGTMKWKFQTYGEVYSSPAIGADGTIYVGWDNGNLYAVRPNGTMKWNFHAGREVDSSPAIGADGTIYVGSSDYVGSGNNDLYAVRPNGTMKWKFSTGLYVDSSPAIGADGTIYVGSEDGNLYAIH
ncbi:MAG: PQQ-binding-like beta-propeller repeat protein [Candidatus Binataceae bacterium]